MKKFLSLRQSNHRQVTDTPMSRIMKLVFWFVAINALGGAGSLIFFPTLTSTLFFWEIKPAVNAALFGALYFGGAIVVAWVTTRGVWETARFLIPILVTAGIMISITTVIHINRFETGIKLVYWLLIYIGAPLLAIAFYIDQERRGANWTVITPVVPATRLLAAAFGGLLCVLGVYLLIFPEGVLKFFPWDMKTLMLRVFASWFTAFGIGLLWFVIEYEWTRVRHVANLMIAASSLDLFMLFIHRSDLVYGLNLWLYCFHLVLFGVIGLLMHWFQRKSKPL